MLAIQLLILVLPIFLSSHAYVSLYQTAQWTREKENSLNVNEETTLEDLEKIIRWPIAKGLDVEKKEFERREEIKNKVDEMVLENLKRIVDDYKKYSAIESNKKMTLGKYRAALRDFNKTHPRRISFFESMRGEMERKLLENL